jgi:hypothetical protein
MRMATIFVCLAMLVHGAGCSRGRPEPSTPLVSAAQLPQTDVLPYPDGPIVAGRNYVYCATFQLAWDKVREQVDGKPVLLAGSPEMATRLNEHHSDAFHLPPESYLAMAGRTDQRIVAKIRETMANRFPNATLGVPDPPRDTVLYIYSYLSRNMPFAEDFETPSSIEFHAAGRIRQVPAFSATFDPDKAKDRAWRKQVTILDYRDDDDFVLRLNTTLEDDELILAKVKPEGTLAATLEAVERRIKVSGEKNPGDEAGMPEEGDYLQVPMIALGVERDYSEVTNHGFENATLRDSYIGEARQGIRFYLDQQGARLESRTYVTTEKKSEVKRGRFFVFDKAFLLYMKRKNASAPYFAMWIGNAELLKQP